MSKNDNMAPGAATPGRRDFLQQASLGIAALTTTRYFGTSAEAASSVQGAGQGASLFASVVDKDKMRPTGEWYEASVPDTLDLAERAELSINALTGNLEPEKFYSVYQGFSLRPPEPTPGGLTWNISPKNARALPWLRTMCGSEKNLDAEYHLMRAMVSQVAADGQVYVPADTDSVPKGTSNPVISGLLAMAVANWYERDKNPEWLKVMRQIGLGLRRIAVQVEDRAYYPLECGYRPDGTWHYERRQGRMLLPYTPPDEPAYDQQGVEGSVKFYGAVPMRALHWCYKLVGDEAALDMARRQARYLLKPSMWVDTRDQGYPGHEHGIFEGHFHGNIGPLCALLELAILEDSARLKELAREGYDHGRRSGVVRMGWFPAWTYPAPDSPWRQGRKPEDHHNRTELCGVSDMLLLAVKLSDAGLGDYWDDVDHIIRNQFAAQQFTDLNLMRLCVGGDPKHDALLSSYLGGFGSARATYNRPAVNGCCSANGAIGLYYAWHGITRFADGVATVNLFLNRASSWMDVDSYLPYEGKVILRNKRAHTALVRVPGWVRSSQVKAMVNDRLVQPGRAGAYLVFQGLTSRDEVQLEFPVSESVDEYTIAGMTYRLSFRGSTMVDISPRTQEPGTYPIFQREHMKAGKAPLKTVERFAADHVMALQ